jgi:hypothetical protein
MLALLKEWTRSMASRSAMWCVVSRTATWMCTASRIECGWERCRVHGCVREDRRTESHEDGCRRCTPMKLTCTWACIHEGWTWTCTWACILEGRTYTWACILKRWTCTAVALRWPNEEGGQRGQGSDLGRSSGGRSTSCSAPWHCSFHRKRCD